MNLQDFEQIKQFLARATELRATLQCLDSCKIPRCSVSIKGSDGLEVFNEGTARLIVDRGINALKKELQKEIESIPITIQQIEPEEYDSGTGVQF